MSNDSNRGDVAVFIDFENVYVSVRDKLDANPNFESIMDRCEDFGRVIIARAYADWYRYPRITSALYANGIEPMYVPTYYYDREQGRTGRAIKNSVDMNLCVDAMRTLYTNPNIVKFVLATGDRDFIPLVNAIRQQGKEVIVIGIGGAASAHLAQSADEFLFYESLIGKPTATATLLPDQPRAKMPEKGRESTNGDSQPTSTNGDIQPAPAPAPEPTEDIYTMLVRAIHLARERGYVCSFGSLKLLMKELNNGEFKESRYKDGSGRPFAKFKDFVLEGERRGKVQVFTNGTVNEVFLPGEDPYKLSQFARDIEEEASAVEAAEKPSEPRSETHNGATEGRRRRRRPRGGQRQAAAHGTSDEQEPQPAETPESGVPAEVLASDFESSEQADAVFERLLERVESEDAAAEGAQFEIVEGTAPTESEPEQPPVAEVVAEVVEEVTAAPEATEFVASTSAPADVEIVSVEPTSAPAETLPALIARPFEPAEWQALREVVARFDRPVSFAHIHNALRDARNTTQLERTNEELRSLVKQAINSGILERIGKGTRVSYRLAPQIEQATEAADDQAAEIEQAEQPTDVTAADEAADQTTLIEQAGDGQVEFATPEAPVEEPAAELVAEEPPARPKRTRRAKPKKAKDESVAEAAAAAVEAAPEATQVAADAAAEPPAKPKRTRRRKAADKPAEAEAAAEPEDA